MTQIFYPGNPSTGPSVTADYSYSYDAMARLSQITDITGTTVATATYTAAGQLATLAQQVASASYGSMTENRTYDAAMLQLTGITVTGVSSMNMQYNYTAGQNNGRITSAKDVLLGQTTSYTYDSLNRLTQASIPRPTPANRSPTTGSVT